MRSVSPMVNTYYAVTRLQDLLYYRCRTDQIEIQTVTPLLLLESLLHSERLCMVKTWMMQRDWGMHIISWLEGRYVFLRCMASVHDIAVSLYRMFRTES